MGRHAARRVPFGLALLLVLPALGLSAGPAAAAWSTARTTKTSGQLSMAKLATAFALRSGQGTDGATFAARNLLSSEVDAVDLTNTGTVALALTGTIVLRPVVSGTVEVWACSAVLVAGNCPAGATSRLLATAAGLGVRTFSVAYGSALAPGAAIHLRVVLSGALYNEATLSVTAAASRGPTDRTAA